MKQAMNTEVVVRASGIEVTAEDESSARSYLREDGLQFRGSWDYELVDSNPTDEEVSDDDSHHVEVDADDPGGSGDRTWTGDVTFTVIVEGEHDDDEAFRLAKEALAR